MPKKTAPKKLQPATPDPLEDQSALAIAPAPAPSELTQQELRMIAGLRRLKDAYRSMLVDLAESLAGTDEARRVTVPRLRLVAKSAA